MGYGIGVQTWARPTMSMMACLRRLSTTDGRLIRGGHDGSGYKIEHDERVLYWFPTSTRNGLVARGMVGDDGRITALGLDAINRHAEEQDSS